MACGWSSSSADSCSSPTPTRACVACSAVAACGRAPAGGIHAGLAGAALTVDVLRPGVRQHVQLLTSGADDVRASADVGGASSWGFICCVSIGVFGRHSNEALSLAAHPGLQAMVATAHRRERRAHDLRDRDRSRAAALAAAQRQGETTMKRRCARDGAAAHRQGAIEALISACSIENLNQPIGRLSRRMFRPSNATMYSPGPKAPALSAMRTWPLESLVRPSMTATRPCRRDRSTP